MTEAGVAWQQYDLSDSEADDVDVARSQDGQGLGEMGMASMKAMEVNSDYKDLQKMCGFWVF